jgi:hypothetical protein
MSTGMFVERSNGELVEMTQQGFESEDLFQELLSNHPALIPGDQMGTTSPRRWLLIAREAGIPGQEGEGARWSLDHLFVDQDAIPTLVEVKRSSDTRIRREVVAQMLDYAANSIEYLSLERMLAAFEETCQSNDQSSDQALQEFLGAEADHEQFWSDVRTNLQAGKVRLLFVADVIPPELERIVEFLNRQMDPAIVLAVEVRQFLGEGLKTYVPRVMGHTVEASQRKGSRKSESSVWNEERILTTIRDNAPTQSQGASRIAEWAHSHNLRLAYGTGKVDGSMYLMLNTEEGSSYTFVLWTSSGISVPFGDIFKRPPFAEISKLNELRTRLNNVLLDADELPEDVSNRWITLGPAYLDDASRLEKFLSVWDWYIEEIVAE